MKTFSRKAFLAAFVILFIAGAGFPVLDARGARDPWNLPVGNFVTKDGNGYLAIRPGGHVYVRREGEDRFTLYRVQVYASVRNEYWTRRVGAITRTVASDIGNRQQIQQEVAAANSKAGQEQSTPTAVPPPAKKSFFARLFEKFKKPAPEEPGAQSNSDESAQTSADEVEAKLATAWFSDSTRLVFLYGTGELSVLVFRDGILRGAPTFRPVNVRLAVPDHAPAGR